MKPEKLWGERFETLPSSGVIDFLSGRDVRAIPPCDERLIPYDLWGSRAHVLMLYQQNIIARRDAEKILKGLREVEVLHREGRFKLDPAKEDVHTNIESFLIERIGIESGGKIHTGRSRNDQIATDIRLYLRDEALSFVEETFDLFDSLLRRAKRHRLTIMPGYTHHQPAMVTTFGHLLLSFAQGLERDIARFFQWMRLFNKNPLGSAAGYGTSFNLDRSLTSRLLGFDGPCENALDPITQRWEPEAEFAYAVAATMNHLSTISETLILLSTAEFNMVRLSDRHCTGSSMMPQKRNPDVLEVMKAKASFAHGMLLSLLSVGKALFMGYHRESQWTKYWIFDVIDESKPALGMMADIIELMSVKEPEMRRRSRTDFIAATPLMEWMAHSLGVPMRRAKTVVEKAVKLSETEGIQEISFSNLKRSLREMKMNLPIKEDEVRKAQAPEEIIRRSQSFGMASERRFLENLASLRQRLREGRNQRTAEKRKILKAKQLVTVMEKRIGP